ncbi:hypothetical protein NLI96_g1960 [Meripilus lineatus]|uniref:Uncharacterized protein n=1 Tax=Meripilus lineatus TaxID=2056292 RepID=A0AAD5YH03_9APHY|nr:hypothetical protein NLI96_g1960 [Physisporinus lineatus]
MSNGNHSDRSNDQTDMAGRRRTRDTASELMEILQASTTNGTRHGSHPPSSSSNEDVADLYLSLPPQPAITNDITPNLSDHSEEMPHPEGRMESQAAEAEEAEEGRGREEPEEEGREEGIREQRPGTPFHTIQPTFSQPLPVETQPVRTSLHPTDVPEPTTSQAPSMDETDNDFLRTAGFESVSWGDVIALLLREQNYSVDELRKLVEEATENHTNERLVHALCSICRQDHGWHPIFPLDEIQRQSRASDSRHQARRETYYDMQERLNLDLNQPLLRRQSTYPRRITPRDEGYIPYNLIIGRRPNPSGFIVRPPVATFRLPTFADEAQRKHPGERTVLGYGSHEWGIVPTSLFHWEWNIHAQYVNLNDFEHRKRIYVVQQYSLVHGSDWEGYENIYKMHYLTPHNTTRLIGVKIMYTGREYRIGTDINHVQGWFVDQELPFTEHTKNPPFMVKWDDFITQNER